MEASPSSATGSSPSRESAAQEKARLRRERRNAKITAGGASRLQAITSLQGGSHRDVEKDVPVKPSPTASPTPRQTGTATPDPEEIDISQHHYVPASQPRLPSPFAYNGSSRPPIPGPAEGAEGQDMLQQMLQQMMGGDGFGGMSGGPTQAGPQTGQPGEVPPGIANVFSAMQGGSLAPDPSSDQSSAWIWRLVHALFSLALAVYLVFQTPFTGSKLSRTSASSADELWTVDTATESFKHFFYLFAITEVVLQTSRYYIEKGQLQGSGILSTIGGLLPEPYSGYVRVVGRYSVIYSTVVSDAMVVVFVLGLASWWVGGAAA